jgi:hypothetical protein
MIQHLFDHRLHRGRRKCRWRRTLQGLRHANVHIHFGRLGDAA